MSTSIEKWGFSIEKESLLSFSKNKWAPNLFKNDEYKKEAIPICSDMSKTEVL